MKGVLAGVMPVPKRSLHQIKSAVGKRSLDRLLTVHVLSALPGALGLGGLKLFPGSVRKLGELEDVDTNAAAELAFERSCSAAEHYRLFGLAAGGRGGGELMQHPQDAGYVPGAFMQRKCLTEEGFRLGHGTGPADDAAQQAEGVGDGELVAEQAQVREFGVPPSPGSLVCYKRGQPALLAGGSAGARVAAAFSRDGGSSRRCR